MRVTATGTHDGEYMGIEPTGGELEGTVMAFQHIEDGQLVEEWKLYDRNGMFQQLGVTVPPTG